MLDKLLSVDYYEATLQRVDFPTVSTPFSTSPVSGGGGSARNIKTNVTQFDKNRKGGGRII